MMDRPSFQAAWTAFKVVHVSVEEVGKKIGGTVDKNINLPPPNNFQNACPIRISYVLNYTGFPVQRSTRFHMITGADRKWYIYRVPEMMEYLRQIFGPPDKEFKNPSPENFKEMKGLIVVKGHGWSNAVGHVTLWDGTQCSDECHLLNDPENGPFVPDTAAIWSLP